MEMGESAGWSESRAGGARPDEAGTISSSAKERRGRLDGSSCRHPQGRWTDRQRKCLIQDGMKRDNHS